MRIEGKKMSFLTACSFLHHASISEDLFKHYPHPISSSSWLQRFLDSSGNWDAGSFSDVVADLVELSIVEPRPREIDGPCRFGLHPLVSEWLKIRAGTSLSFLQNAAQEAFFYSGIYFTSFGVYVDRAEILLSDCAETELYLT